MVVGAAGAGTGSFLVEDSAVSVVDNPGTAFGVLVFGFCDAGCGRLAGWNWSASGSGSQCTRSRMMMMTMRDIPGFTGVGFQRCESGDDELLESRRSA